VTICCGLADAASDKPFFAVCAMPFRFKFDESLKVGFRRIAGEQLNLAVRQLSNDPVSVTAVHESRKALKRLRALIRCCAPALGAKAAAQHNAAIRDIARRMSSRRDCDVAGMTLAQLESHFGTDAVDVLAPLKIQLAAKRAEGAVLLDAGEREEIVKLLQRQAKRIDRAPVKGRGHGHAIAGIEIHYRKGQKALKVALAKPSDEAMHELRKAVQSHWRHMALLSRAWPDEFAARVAAARELSQMLGDDHDIALLKAAAKGLDEAQCGAICKLCEQRQAEIRDAVTYAARRMYAEPAPAFGRRMAAIWDAGRRIKPLASGADKQALPEPPKLLVAPTSTGDGSPAPLAAKTLVSSGSQRRA
jgi:CHAD domain-containing protein